MKKSDNEPAKTPNDEGDVAFVFFEFLVEALVDAEVEAEFLDAAELGELEKHIADNKGDKILKILPLRLNKTTTTQKIKLK